MTYTIRDPFAGHLEIEGDTIEEAVAAAYKNIPVSERPTHVWFGDEKIAVPEGTCSPLQ